MFYTTGVVPLWARLNWWDAGFQDKISHQWEACGDARTQGPPAVLPRELLLPLLDSSSQQHTRPFLFSGAFGPSAEKKGHDDRVLHVEAPSF
jgi:hypothetical protein